MKKTFISVFTIFIGVALITSTAFPWGSATHAYIDDQIGKRLGPKNKNEIYGGMAPDIFNYAFDLPQPLYDYLRAETHGVYGDTTDDKYFMKVWNEAGWGFQENLGFGFVSHNDMWGADSTAHWRARTNPIEGYVITKAVILEVALSDAWILLGIDHPDYYPLRVELCHNLIETAGDIIIRRIDRRVGQKVMTSALTRHHSFPDLLVSAYAEGLINLPGMSYPKAVGLITTAEKEFRKMMILYGNALVRSEDKAIQLLAEQLAELAEIFVGIPVSSELAEEALRAAISVLEMYGDYYAEISATIDNVVLELESHGVSY